MSKDKIQYNNIDLFKFIFAIIIVMMHATPFKDISENVSWYFDNTLASLAVPFFFVTSGFLLFGKLANCEEERRNDIVKKYLIHLLRMYLIWCVIWIPLKALNYYNSGAFTVVDFMKCIRDIVFVQGGDALWYLPALISSTAIIYIYIYKVKTSKATLLVLSSVLFAVGYLISSWYGIFEGNIFVEKYYMIFATVNNGLFKGMIFVAIGMIIADNKKESKIINDIIWFIVFFVLLCFESYIIKNSGLSKGIYNNAMLPAVVYFMFKIILNIKIHGNEQVFRRLREFSTLIYLSHCFIIRCIKIFAGILDVNIPYVVLFIITLMLSLAFAAIVRYLSTNKKFMWVKLLY